jgi:hypothetical protein
MFVSAAGVVAACYLISVATWIQVLLLFLAASIGWCAFVCLMERREEARLNQAPRMIRVRRGEATEKVATPSSSVSEAVPPAPIQTASPKVYKFPIHKLSGRALTT